MKKAVLMMMFMLCILNTKAQITLSSSYSSTFAGWQNAQVVNLSISGKKILVITNANTLSFYNLDYSLWRTITLPIIPPYTTIGLSGGGISLELGSGGTVMYPSETLFNTDSLLEVAVFYGATNSSAASIYIINETGVAIDSIKNVLWNGSNWSPMMIYSTSSTTFNAIVGSSSGANVYSLPGTIPCDACSSGNGLGLGSVQPKQTGISEPVPNPSNGKVKITFTLPAGTTQGELDIFNMSGQKLKTYKVDNTFGYITIDNSEFPAGMYYYNLIADGNITITKKMVVVK